uniref:Uncharacterized protein n=1 Tax=Anguilla anguilla TaxID=7936 RepID=A0A0E9RGS0_ANGAN
MVEQCDYMNLLLHLCVYCFRLTVPYSLTAVQ